MEIKYSCCNGECRKVLKQPYEYVVKLDHIMDEKNMAQLYCPHCGSELREE